MLDKDGIFAAVRMAELIAFLERQGKTLLQLLDELYDRQASLKQRASPIIAKDGI